MCGTRVRRSHLRRLKKKSLWLALISSVYGPFNIPRQVLKEFEASQQAAEKLAAAQDCPRSGEK